MGKSVSLRAAENTVLTQLYIGGATYQTIRAVLNLTNGSIDWRLKSLGIQKTKQEYLNLRKKNAKGLTLTQSGYLAFTIGPHVRRYVHVVVMESYVGRPIADDEEVHHIDGNKLNNTLSNLVLMSESDHQRCHMKQRIRDTKGRMTTSNWDVDDEFFDESGNPLTPAQYALRRATLEDIWTRLAKEMREHNNSHPGIPFELPQWYSDAPDLVWRKAP